MADAGIVRNRAKIDATIGNAAALLATADGVRLVRCAISRRWCLRRRRDCRRPRRPADIPATTPGLRRAVGGPRAARLPLRRLDDRVRVHAERRPGRRPPAGLLPLRLPFTLLADPEHEASEAYGVWGERNYAGKKYMGVTRSTFVIDSDGTVSKVMRGVKADTHAEKVLAALPT